MLPLELLLGVAVKLLRARVHAHEGAVQGLRVDGVVRVLHQRCQPGLRLVRPLAFGDVARDSYEQGLVLEADLADGKFHRKGRTVLAASRHLATLAGDREGVSRLARALLVGGRCP